METLTVHNNTLIYGVHIYESGCVN